jgi:hypothetical protein
VIRDLEGGCSEINRQTASSKIRSRILPAWSIGGDWVKGEVKRDKEGKERFGKK